MYQAVLVDDESYIIEDLLSAIDWSGYNIDISFSTTSPLEALEYIRSHSVHLLITDVSMPQMTGIELIKAAKEANPLLTAIVLSAYNNFEYVRSAMRNGAENYLLKPLDPNDLMESISQFANNMQEREKISRSFGASILTFRSNFAEQWVKNLLSPNELSERATLLGINVDSDNYTVVIFNSPSADSVKMSEFYDMLLSSLVGNCMSTIYFESPQRLVCILSMVGPIRDLKKLVIEEAELKASLLSFPLFISIGSTVGFYTNVPESYTTAHTMLYLTYSTLPFFLYHQNLFGINKCLDDQFSPLSSNASFQTEDYITVARRVFTAASTSESAYHVCLLMIPYLLRKLTKEVIEIPQRFPTILSLLADLPKKGLTQKLYLDYSVNFIRECSNAILLSQNEFPFVDAVIKAVHDFSDKDISLKTLAIKLNMSPSYLGNMFKKQTGYYFNDYLAEARLKYAALLIETTDMKMKDIVDQVGFSSQTYFNRSFKRYFNVSPVAYRRNKKISTLTS